MRRSVDNFFANAADAWSAVNNVLQGKPQPAFDDVVRFTTNTVFGFFGILDIASEFGLEHHYEDFGQTLGRWGVPSGPYLVLPLFGPSSVRDGAGLIVDLAVDPIQQIDSTGTRNSIGVSSTRSRSTRRLPLRVPSIALRSSVIRTPTMSAARRRW